MTFSMDPQVDAVLAAAFASNGPPPAPPAGDVQGRRAALNPMLDYFNNQAQTAPDGVEISDHQVLAADGTELLARWYRPSAGGSGAAVLYLHGGGMILGSVPIFDGPVARYVAGSGVAMLSIQYRLAPEHPHPTPVEDAYAGLTWLANHAPQLGVDPDRLAVMGDSAGGGLAAALAILTRDRRGPQLTHQLLIYPMLDDRNTTPDPQIVPFAGWSYDDNITGWDALLGAGHEHRDIDTSAAPARITDATGLPPAYIEVGQLDIFRDEDVRYALTLSQAGVPVELHLHPGVPHEYDAIASTSDVARRAQSDRERILRSL
ncbi:Acetyl esterase/lipase [Nakamurella panacisegetis]|uniref:Acetyl esterase/lipase n=1 Tax=Nakamurella panacisegetis TaxID=1090615 RepID=A0A1H0QNL2_9ACTN|nr:alpha/beta hydrolase [Nakamurella panacisegetis]SDP18258.1 Acetyl esterase/lipase [Nakamurella panacisegetis]